MCADSADVFQEGLAPCPCESRMGHRNTAVTLFHLASDVTDDFPSELTQHCHWGHTKLFGQSLRDSPTCRSHGTNRGNARGLYRLRQLKQLGLQTPKTSKFMHVCAAFVKYKD